MLSHIKKPCSCARTPKHGLFSVWLCGPLFFDLHTSRRLTGYSICCHSLQQAKPEAEQCLQPFSPLPLHFCSCCLSSATVLVSVGIGVGEKFQCTEMVLHPVNSSRSGARAVLVGWVAHITATHEPCKRGTHRELAAATSLF